MILITKDIEKIDSKEAYQLNVDGSTIHKLEDLYLFLSEELSFPDYFGNNLDALFDCLCDLPEEKCPLQLSISNSMDFLKGALEEDRDDLFCLLNDVQETWSQEMDPGFFTVIVEDFKESKEFFDMLFIQTDRI